MRIPLTLLVVGQCLSQLVSNQMAVSVEPALEPPGIDVLTEEEWQRVDNCVQKGLAWLASVQQRDGSFPTLPHGQPAVTGLCVMSFMAHGHTPGVGRYGKQLQRAIEYIASCQKRSGLIALVAPNSPTILREVGHEIGWPASYNHAISALALGESFSTGRGLEVERLESVITKSLEATFEMQKWSKRRAEDEGGWRYINRFQDGYDSDLSATGWYLMSLRSAKNAGFDVPKRSIDDAVDYVNRCFHRQYGTFHLMASNKARLSRGMAGAGILAMAHAGKHQLPEVRATGDWLLNHKFDQYNARPSGWGDDRYHYGVFNCCQGMYQLGGRHWEQFFPSTARTLVANQQPSGSWQSDTHQHDGRYGESYTTSLVVLALGAPNQLLPIFQR